eukprot:3375920-Prymnesium_polylepis.1
MATMPTAPSVGRHASKHSYTWEGTCEGGLNNVGPGVTGPDNHQDPSNCQNVIVLIRSVTSNAEILSEEGMILEIGVGKRDAVPCTEDVCADRRCCGTSKWLHIN